MLLVGCDAQPDGAKATSCEQREFEGSRFTACRYDTRQDRIEMIVDDGQRPLRTFARLNAHLGSRARSLRFAMNAGMYDETGLPIGLYVEHGRVRHRMNSASGSGNFTLKPNGVFAVDSGGRPWVMTSDLWSSLPRSPVWATQSGPMLVIDGRLHPRIQPNGPSLHLRNGVGVADARTAWFVISDDPVSFGRLARFFRDSLGCRNALYLDGAVSSLWDRPAGRQDERAELGPMILVFRR